MKYKIISYILTGLLILFGCNQEELFLEKSQNHDTKELMNQPVDYLDGWVRVKFKLLDQNLNTQPTSNGTIYTGIKELDEVVTILGATKIQRVFNDGGKFKKRREKYGLHLWYDFYVGNQSNITRSVNSFSNLPFIEFVELIPVDRQNILFDNFFNQHNEVFVPTFTYSNVRNGFSGDGHSFNDPLLKRQWHYYNDGSTPSSIAGADANVFPAWKITTGHPDVIVAVVDGGIDFSHPDLSQNMWVNPQEIAGNGIDDDNNGYIDDIHGFRWGRTGVGEPTGEIFPMDHGSHCAGTIAAVNNNAVGLAGVAGGNGNPSSGIRLMSCQTYVPDPAFPEDPHGNSKSTSQTPDAFAYAADNGAVIVNCSFSYSGTSLSAAYKAGIDYFIDNAGIDENGVQIGPMKGGLMIASAGNDGEKDLTKYPASYERVISVAYTMSNYLKSPSSNYGYPINVTAPGGATSSSYAPDRVGGIYSTVPMRSRNFHVEKGYAYKSGTSMAAPHVAGIAALVLSAAIENNIPMTNDKLRNIIERSCWSLDKYNPEFKGMLGKGQVDAAFALQILLGGDIQPVSTPKNIDIISDTNSLNLQWDVPKDFFDNPVEFSELYWSLNVLKNSDLNDMPSGVKKETIENKKNIGEKEERVISNLSPDTEYHIALIFTDRQGQKSVPVFISQKTKKISTSKDNQNSMFLLYPNPVTDFLYIKSPVTSYGKKVIIEFYNSVGHNTYTHEVIGNATETKVPVGKLTGGVYTVYLKYLDKQEKKTIIKY